MILYDDFEWRFLYDDFGCWCLMMILNDGFGWWFWMMIVDADFVWWFLMMILNDGFGWWFWMMILDDDFGWWFLIMVFQKSIIPGRGPILAIFRFLILFFREQVFFFLHFFEKTHRKFSHLEKLHFNHPHPLDIQQSYVEMTTCQIEIRCIFLCSHMHAWKKKNTLLFETNVFPPNLLGRHLVSCFR